MKPFVGCPVVLIPGPHNSHLHSNGRKATDPIAAIVTRVWSDDVVNLIAFPDAAAPQHCGSVGSKERVEALAGGDPVESAYWMDLADDDDLLDPLPAVELEVQTAPELQAAPESQQ